MHQTLIGLAFVISLSACATYTFNDSRNESLVEKNIRSADAAFEEAHITVTSFNGIVLLTGQVPDARLLPIATQQAKSLRAVDRVYNELKVAGQTSFISRTNDSYLTARVVAALAGNELTDADRIKVVTENGVVYLIGTLTRAEADEAVSVAQSVTGVQKIVKAFDFIN